MKRNPRWECRCLRGPFFAIMIVVTALACAAARKAAAQLLVNNSNSAMGASSSAPDAAHFQNAGSITNRAAYIGYSTATGTGYMDNTGGLTANGTNGGSNVYDISENWGVGVGVFEGGQGYFINSGAGTVTSSHEIRVGDGFGGTSHGEFYQQSSGAVTAGDYLTVGNSGGTGKFVQSGTGAVDVGYELWVGVYGGAHGDYAITNSAANLHVATTLWLGDSGGVGAFSQSNGTVVLDRYLFNGSYGGTGIYTQESGNATIGYAGNDFTVTAPELYLGYVGGNGRYDLNGGTLTVYGWTNIGRDSGTGVFNNKGMFSTQNELRVGANYSDTSTGGNGTVHNLAGGHIEAGQLYIAHVAYAGVSATGHFTTEEGSDTTVYGPIIVGAGPSGTGDFTMNGGTVTTTTNTGPIQVGYVPNATGTFTMNKGTVNCNDWVVIGTFGGTGHGAQHGGTINTVIFDVAQGDSFNSNQAQGDYTLDNTIGLTTDPAKIVTSDWMAVGDYGIGTFHQVAGEVHVGTGLYIGEITPATGYGGEWIMDNGSIAANDIIFVGDGGSGHLKQSNGTISAGDFVSLGRGTGSSGTYDHSGGSFVTPYDFNVGDFGTGELNQTGGSIQAGQFIVGWQPTGAGTATITGGTVTSDGWTIVGQFGQNAHLAINNGASLTVGDNLNIGRFAGADGEMTIGTNTTVKVNGDFPAYTGNVVVGDHGHGTLNMTGGTLNMIVGPTPSMTDPLGTNNSASFSVAHASGLGTELDHAQDGNFSIAEEEGVGIADISGSSVVNVAANIFVGGMYVDLETSPPVPILIGGTGTLTIRESAQVRVGLTSPTGGDLVLGSPANAPVSTATVNLRGGLLDVTKSYTDGMGNSYGGNIGSGGAGSVTVFNFSGGTLKARVWNAAGPFGGSLGNLVQNGAGSLLDVTGNDTTLNNSSYNLGEGSATIGSGRTLTAQGVINSGGAGVINVGTGSVSPAGDYNQNGVVDAADFVLWRKNPGAYGGTPGGYNTWRANFGATGAGSAGVLTVGAGSVDVDTLNLNNGSVTAGGGVSVATVLSGRGTISNNLTLGASAITKLTINSASSFDKIVVGGALNFAGSLQVTLGFTPAVNQTFDVFDFVGHTGTFTAVGPNSWDTSQLYSDGILKYLAPGSGSSLDSAGSVPEPATCILVAMAVGALVGNRSTRGRRA